MLFEFLGLSVSSALGMQILLCIEWVKYKGLAAHLYSGISRFGGKSLPPRVRVSDPNCPYHGA
jgi:hypothetical protein